MPNTCQAIIWTNDGSIYWCTYASLGLNELKYISQQIIKDENLINNNSSKKYDKLLKETELAITEQLQLQLRGNLVWRLKAVIIQKKPSVSLLFEKADYY